MSGTHNDISARFGVLRNKNSFIPERLLQWMLLNSQQSFGCLVPGDRQIRVIKLNEASNGYKLDPEKVNAFDMSLEDIGDAADRVKGGIGVFIGSPGQENLTPLQVALAKQIVWELGTLCVSLEAHIRSGERGRAAAKSFLMRMAEMTDRYSGESGAPLLASLNEAIDASSEPWSLVGAEVFGSGSERGARLLGKGLAKIRNPQQVRNWLQNILNVVNAFVGDQENVVEGNYITIDFQQKSKAGTAPSCPSGGKPPSHQTKVNPRNTCWAISWDPALLVGPTVRDAWQPPAPLDGRRISSEIDEVLAVYHPSGLARRYEGGKVGVNISLKDLKWSKHEGARPFFSTGLETYIMNILAKDAEAAAVVSRSPAKPFGAPRRRKRSRSAVAAESEVGESKEHEPEAGAEVVVRAPRKRARVPPKPRPTSEKDTSDNSGGLLLAAACVGVLLMMR